jgi:hypothetical protein
MAHMELQVSSMEEGKFGYEDLEVWQKAID